MTRCEFMNDTHTWWVYGNGQEPGGKRVAARLGVSWNVVSSNFVRVFGETGSRVLILKLFAVSLIQSPIVGDFLYF